MAGSAVSIGVSSSPSNSMGVFVASLVGAVVVVVVSEDGFVAVIVEDAAVTAVAAATAEEASNFANRNRRASSGDTAAVWPIDSPPPNVLPPVVGIRDP